MLTQQTRLTSANLLSSGSFSVKDRSSSLCSDWAKWLLKSWSFGGIKHGPSNWVMYQFFRIIHQASNLQICWSLGNSVFFDFWWIVIRKNNLFKFGGKLPVLLGFWPQILQKSSFPLYIEAFIVLKLLKHPSSFNFSSNSEKTYLWWKVFFQN